MITKFLEYQRINKGLSEQTIEGYQKELLVFIHFGQKRNLRWSTITKEDIDNFVSDEVSRGMKPRTIKRRVECVRLLYTWACHEGILNYNPAQYTQTPKISMELPKAADMDRLRNYVNSEATSRESFIVHIICSLIMETGMRIGEITAMRGEDIDTKNNCIRIKGKGGKERIVYYGNLSAKYAKIMAIRKGQIFEETPKTYRYMMYAELPGVHPHAIRHAFACDQLNKGMDLKTLSTLMGHKHTTTTEIYAQMTNSRTRAIYNQINS